jgi:hypothetical protein
MFWCGVSIFVHIGCVDKMNELLSITNGTETRKAWNSIDDISEG